MSMQSHVLDPQASKWEAVAGARPWPQETIHRRILAAAKPVGSSPAVRGPKSAGSREITFDQLVDGAFNVACALGERNPDSYVGVLVPRDVEHIVCIFGVMISGAAFLPMSSTIPEDRMRFIMEDSGCDTIMTTDGYKELIDWFQGSIFVYSELPQQRRDNRLESMSLRSGVSNVAYAIYTSGTTGKPKGVEVEHGGVVNMLHFHQTQSLVKEDVARSVVVASFIFDSSIREIFLPLTYGCCLCIADNTLNITEGTCVGGTPSGLAVSILPPTVQAALIGGERLTAACVKNLANVKTIVNVYGPTETTVECTTHYTDRSKPEEIPLIGTPVSNAHAYGVHRENRQLVPHGEQCELFIGGPGVARGYRNRPDLNESKFIKNPFGEGRVFVTGDLVKWSIGGNIEFLGRTDSQVKIRGYRIELEEIERVCSEVPGVENACVVVANDMRKQEQIVVYVTFKNAPVEEKDIKELAAEKMPPYMVPALVMGLEKFELTTSGKIDKKQLPPPVWAQPVITTAVVDAATPMEKALVSLVEAVFELSVSVDSDFFIDLGLTSLDCAALVAEARTIGIVIEGTADILANPTVQKLSKHLSKAGDASEIELRKRRFAAACAAATTMNISERADLAASPLSLRKQYAVYSIGFILQILLCYFPPVATAVLLLVEAHFFWEAEFTGKFDTQLPWKAAPMFDTGFWGVMCAVPVAILASALVAMLSTILIKWTVMCKYKTGTFAVGSAYYMRWWFVNSCLHFVNLLVLPPLRNTSFINLYYRCLGMSIGWGSALDTTFILDPDLIRIGAGCSIQSDALLAGHVLRYLADDNVQVLTLAHIDISDGIVVGPGATVVSKDETPLMLTWNLPALTTAQMLPEDFEVVKDQYLPMLSINIVVQCLALLVSGIIHSLALCPVVALFYHFFIWQGLGPLSHGWYLGWWAASYWTAGFPYMLLIVAYKWIVIGRFREGPCKTKNRGFILGMLMQSLVLRESMWIGASSWVIMTFYRMLGVTVGWNAQVMPFTCLEFDLLTIGDSVAFGGLVSFFPCGPDGTLKRISVGKNSAVTNSAVIMGGTEIGCNGLVGNLTLCPTDTKVADNTKCVGNPMLKFSSEAPEDVEEERMKSNFIMFCHLVAGMLLFIDIPLLLNIYLFEDLMFSHLRTLVTSESRFSVGLMVDAALLLVSYALTIVANVAVRRRFFSPRYVGEHARDSFVFVQFIFYTKMIVMADWHFFRMLNGTPFMPMLLKFMGGNVDSSAVMYCRHVADFDSLTVSQNAIINFDSYLETHQKTATQLLYEPVEIGEGSVVGHRSIMLRGSILGHGSVAMSNTTILPGEEVPPVSIVAMNPGKVLIEGEQKVDQQGLVAAAKKAGRNSVAGLRASTRHKEEAQRDNGQGGQGSAARSSVRRASLRKQGSGKGQQTQVKAARASIRTQSAAAMNVSKEDLSMGTEETIDMVIVGSGVCGLIAAGECIDQKKSYIVLEKSNDIMGCWPQCANHTSHVAVCEPSYRFDREYNGKYPSDFTSRDDIIASGRSYVEEKGIKTRLQSWVTGIEREKEMWKITYVKNNKLCTIWAKGVFIAIGAQQVERKIKIDGEESFSGTTSTGIRDHMPVDMYKGANVVIVGGGAFAMENLRTALNHGAAHVTIVYRTAIQCLPRFLHYLLTLGNITVGEVSEYYDAALKWAGLDQGQVEPFFSKKCVAQPTASDMFFLAYKAGRLTLKKGQVKKVSHRSLTTDDGTEFPCDVLLKCLGWQEPALQKVFPDFQSRRFMFLNGYSSMTFVCDPHYQHKPGSNRTLSTLHGVKIKGGTFSVPSYAATAIRLQLFFMENPDQYAKAMLQVQECPQAVCSWFQQRWEFDDLPQVNALITETLAKYKNATLAKFPDRSDYIKMAQGRFNADAANWLPGGPVGYIFNPDGTGNYYDFPQDRMEVKQGSISQKAIEKSGKAEEQPTGPSLQKAAYAAL